MKDLLKNKRIVVTGSSSGIGLETARLLTEQGAEVLGVDINKNFDHVEEFYRADLSDPRTIDALIDAMPGQIDGLVNNAGLPPTRPADKVITVNLVGVKRLTVGLIPKMNNGASIVNVASVAGIGWPNSVPACKASFDLDFDGVDAFIARWNISSEGGRSYFFS
jgi:NAD(P)-dependent dehydrogenase (short-subunit alcohol dehydrogenase family)